MSTPSPYQKEIKVSYIPQEDNATGIFYLLHGPKATIQFWFRCPTVNWHYYVACDLGYHADEAQYDGQSPMSACPCRKGGKCYYDGTALGAQGLFNKFISSGMKEEVIWDKLEECMKRFK